MTDKPADNMPAIADGSPTGVSITANKFVIAELETSRVGVVVRVGVERYRRRIYAALRKWYTPKGGGPLAPTPQGFNIPIEQVEQLILSLHEALDKAVEQDWL